MVFDHPRTGIGLVVLGIFGIIMAVGIGGSFHSSLTTIAVFATVAAYFYHLCKNSTYAYANAACVGLAFAIARPIFWGHELIPFVGVVIVLAVTGYLLWVAVDTMANHV